MGLLALPLLLDKAIAHTKGYVRSHYGLYTPMMWCHCYHLHSKRNFARISSMKIISITPFTKKVLLLADNSLSYGKVSAKVVKVFKYPLDTMDKYAQNL